MAEKEPTQELMEKVINNGMLGELLLLKETSWFEFREKPYATTVAEPGASKAKYELAKDCSSISNSGGGYIFIGLKPKKSDNQMTEFVSEIVGFKKADINLESWRDSMASLITPRFTLEDIDHGFIDIDKSRVVMWMRIPSAEEKGVFPLIFHTDQWHTPGKHKIKGKAIGLYERHGAENIMLSSEKIQSYMSRGLVGEA